METCKFCGAPLAGQYYRVVSEMGCVPCGKRIGDEATRDEGKLISRGILYAAGAAIVGSVLRCGFEMMFSGGAGGTGIISISAFLRWFVFLGITTMIVMAAKAGSKGRGGIALQVCATLFTYLSFSLAFAPLLWAKIPAMYHGPQLLVRVIVVSLELPVISVARNPWNLTGLAVTIFCMFSVWKATERPASQVEGPFEVTDPSSERPMFKSLA